MKKGDLVRLKFGPSRMFGVIVGLDSRCQPIVYWNKTFPHEHELFVDLKVVNEKR